VVVVVVVGRGRGLCPGCALGPCCWRWEGGRDGRAGSGEGRGVVLDLDCVID
jgi:hypothetical protein